jgi:MinD-like ATPase involved in chromosome partitioning or flagellar assembly
MILSFYSYKGGVGRTQLVANVASYLCFYKHKRILLLEWDLEAPGLHFYFDKTNANIRQEGLIELLLRYNALAQKGEKYGEADLPYFTEEYIVRGLKTSGKNKGTIDLIPAAKYAEPFSQKINDFNWREFMELYDGKVYMDFLKKELKN